MKTCAIFYAFSVAGLIVAAIPVRAETPPGRYVVAGAGLVTDLRTGLTWQQTPDMAFYTWMEASTYCRSFSVGLSSGFRLPSLKEMLTLVDPTRVAPALDIMMFPNTPPEWFWTASDRSPMGPAAVSFDTGATSFFAATDSLRVRCVR